MSRDREVCPFCGRSISLSPKSREFAAHLRRRGDGWCPGSSSTLAKATDDAIPEETLVVAIEMALASDPDALKAFRILERRYSEIEAECW